MSEEVIAEVQGPLVFRIIYDKELGYLFANIPINKRISSSALREIMTITNDPWRYLDGVGLVLDLSAWAQEGDVDVQAIGKALEAKYKEILPVIKEVVDKVQTVKKKKSKKRRKRKKASRRKRRSRKSK
ncbi:MAG: hypothetical protein TU35_007935 [Thermoproteus sp. AZ2]|uniref:Uncharacterized protein n=1 Tax=Thermoproteus sp. AZ2 TaxID=1609232 RepID=A0ACC6V2I5_9CREN